MIDPPVKVGVIGCGAQGKNHLNVIRELPPETAIVRAFCDLSPDRLQNAREMWPQACATSDFKEMLAPGELDLVIVATMPNTHMQMALAALEAGADVLCEKPFMRNLEEATAVLNCAERLGRQVQLGTNMRYMATSGYLRDLVDSGTVGEPVLSKVWGCHVNPPWWGPHYYLSSSAGGVLASTLIHALDLVIWVAGSPNPVSVSASMRRLFPGKRGPLATPEIRQRFNVEDLLTAFVRFDDGSACMLEGNWCDDSPPPHHFEMVTTRGELNSDPFTVTVDENGEVVDKTPQLKESSGWGDSIRNQDTDVIQRLLDGTPWIMQDRQQLLNLQRLIDGCYESARIEREVVFEQEA
ncbi:Gfo/Idh/MocA family oxidoreductase [Candidatus Poribacteria bacterium]|nr:Gfo/Idh/MocA family oxidoreductase [Candidatus Poribacteria bacterium]